MGQTKRKVEREMERRYSSIDACVCSHCVSDKYIKLFIKTNGVESICDYCEKNRVRTIDFDELVEFVLGHIDSVYDDPLEDFVNFDDGKTFGITELLFDIDLTEQESLRDDIEKSLSDRVWCEKPYYHWKESDALKAGWEKFSEVSKKYRYTYHQLDDDDLHEPISPSNFLEDLSRTISQLILYKTLRKDTFIYRVRVHKKVIDNQRIKLEKASELAPPLPEQAKYPNRMSPSGAPMFYGAFDIGTAIKETYSSCDTEVVATIAKFKLLKNIELIDLSKIPDYLGFFEDADYNNQQIEFLNDFVKAISKPIDKDGAEHIDYIPTQIITEHLRNIHHKLYENEQILGLIYPSSKFKARNSIVIFCENEHCVEKGEEREDSFFELELPLREVNPKSYI